MRLLIVGSDRIYSIENFYVKYFREAGVALNHFPAQRYFYDYYQAGIINKLLFRLGLSGVLNQINRRFKEEVLLFEPTIIWVFKGMELFPSTLQWAKEKGIKLVNFNGDNPFLFSGRGSGNAHVTDSIRLYDLHLTYDRSIQKKIRDKFSIPTKILPFGYDINESLFETCAMAAEVQRVCFLGNPDEFRGRFLQQLAEQGIPLDLYGNNWGAFVKHPDVQIFDPVYADDCWRVLRKYRVQLNLMRPHNPDSHNMRSFELAGIGAIQLAPATADHTTYFKPGEEIFVYENLDDCKQQIHKLLHMDKSQANSIRERVRARAEHGGYSYKARAAEVLEYLNELNG